MYVCMHMYIHMHMSMHMHVHVCVIMQHDIILTAVRGLLYHCGTF